MCSLPKPDMPISEQALNLLTRQYGEGAAPEIVSVPGRVNLIGEHIDYHDLPVLPMAIQRHVSIAYRVRRDERVRAVSMAEATDRQFVLSPRLEPAREGDWVNYLLAAAAAVQTRWPLPRGIDAAVASDLPIAAGLSSSSALLAGFAIALLRANGLHPTVEQLMSVLPEGEHFVGTRGGGMDHAAVLAARRESALLIGFAPLAFRHVRIPPDWAFLVAHSLTTAEKSGAMRSKYNALREEGIGALRTLGSSSFRAAIADGPPDAAQNRLTGRERKVHLHVTSEALRVHEAVAALEQDDIADFGRLLAASHESLRSNLGVSTSDIDALVTAAMDSGALGARLTGAGFGGCVIVLCTTGTRDRVRERLITAYYSNRSDFDPHKHLFHAHASDGALAE